jgi:hypothetical protein
VRICVNGEQVIFFNEVEYRLKINIYRLLYGTQNCRCKWSINYTEIILDIAHYPLFVFIFTDYR